MPDFNNMFLVLFVLLFTALGISSMINREKANGARIFGTLYLAAAVAMIAYKMNNP